MQIAGNPSAPDYAPIEMERQVQDLMSRRALMEAADLAACLRRQYPGRAGGWILGAQIAQGLHDFAGMQELAEAVLADHPDRKDVQFLVVDAQIADGKIAEAIAVEPSRSWSESTCTQA